MTLARFGCIVAASVGWRFWDGWVAIFCIAVALSASDAIYLLWARGWDSAGLTARAFALELWAVSVALVPLACVLGLLLVGAGRATDHNEIQGLRHWFFSGSEKQRVKRAASLLAATVLFLLGLAACACASFWLDRRIVQPHFHAWASAAAFGVIALMFAGAYPLVRRAVSRLLSVAAPIAVIGWPARNPLNLTLFLFGIGCVVFVPIASRFWRDTLAYAPWSVLLRALGAAMLAFVLYSLWRHNRDRPRVRRIAALVIVLTMAIVSVPAVQLSAAQWELRRAAFDDAFGGKMARSALRATLDRDGDGFLSFVGDGDCAPKDRRIYYGARDIPNNGVDEDCDGADLAIPDVALCPFRAGDRPATVPDELDIVFITVDALAAQRLGIAGYPRRITPNLDAFARQSVYFDSAFAQGPSTRLSLPALFTSKWDSLLKRTPRPRLPYAISRNETLLAEALSDAGYDAVAVVSDRNFVRSYWPSITRGFATVDESVVSSKHNAERVTDRALQALRRDRKQPLFLWVHYYDPHAPYHQPEDAPRFGFSDADIYDAEVFHTDRALGPLLTALESRPNTLTIIASDHGTVFHPEPRTREARYGYDVYTATLHVPMLFHASFLTPRVWSGPASTLDIYPTLADLLSMKAAPALCGDSLAPVLLGSDSRAPRLTFHEFYLPERAGRDGKDPLLKVSARDARYNLVLNREDGSFELYDWRRDYFETKNLVTSADHQAAFARLRSAIAGFTHRAHTWHDQETPITPMNEASR